MHERRNFILILLLIAAVIWGVAVWLFAGESIGVASTALWIQRISALALVAGLGGVLAWAMLVEDKLPDQLRGVVGELYFDVDGLSFMPIVRTDASGRAELCIYYQNRFENPADAVVHLRPPLDSFVIREGMRDAHFAFRAGGGDFGCIHQPIAVPRHLQGEIVHVELAAASHFPRGHGSRLRRRPGMRCGEIEIDWHGAAFKTGVHEVSGEIELHDPVHLHLSMPQGVTTRLDERTPHWKQERLAAGIEP